MYISINTMAKIIFQVDRDGHATISNENHNHNRDKTPMSLKIFQPIMIVLLISAILYLFLLDEDLEKPTDILQGAMENFKLENGRELYCTRQLNAVRIFRAIQKRVLNQQAALNKMAHIIQAQKRFQTIILLGPAGVGKSLTALTLRQHFPWPENTHMYSWDTQVPDEVHKFHLVRYFAESLSLCGRNLLIIDNLSVCDFGFVNIFNKLVHDREGDFVAATRTYVLIIYIFNMEPDQFQEELKFLQNIGNTHLIRFKAFGQRELIDCIENELVLENRIMPQNILEYVANSLDGQKFGCKYVREKVLEYGKVYG